MGKHQKLDVLLQPCQEGEGWVMAIQGNFLALAKSQPHPGMMNLVLL